MGCMLSENLLAERIKAYWESPATVSLRDPNLRQLEIETVASLLSPEDCVLDIGCGDGQGTVAYARMVRSILGIDHSARMVSEAEQRRRDADAPNARFIRGDLFNLSALCDGEQFDRVITERCLINLPGWEEQQEAIRVLARVLKPNGAYLMCETTLEGAEKLNALRARVGLEGIPIPWHNKPFAEDRLFPFLEKRFHLRDRIDFGLYYFLSRVINPLLGTPDNPIYDVRIDEVARRISSLISMTELRGVGPITVLHLKKKG